MDADLSQLSLPLLSFNHKIPGWFGLEVTVKLIQFHPRAMCRGTFHEPRLLNVKITPGISNTLLIIVCKTTWSCL